MIWTLQVIQIKNMHGAPLQGSNPGGTQIELDRGVPLEPQTPTHL